MGSRTTSAFSGDVASGGPSRTQPGEGAGSPRSIKEAVGAIREATAEIGSRSRRTRSALTYPRFFWRSAARRALRFGGNTGGGASGGGEPPNLACNPRSPPGADLPPPLTPAIRETFVTRPSIAPKTAGRSRPPDTSRCCVSGPGASSACGVTLNAAGCKERDRSDRHQGSRQPSEKLGCAPVYVLPHDRPIRRDEHGDDDERSGGDTIDDGDKHEELDWIHGQQAEGH